MPPLKEVSALSSLSGASLASLLTQTVHANLANPAGISLVRGLCAELPAYALETLYATCIPLISAVLPSMEDEDDHVVLERHCSLLSALLDCLLQPHVTSVEQDFDIDARKFKNFVMKPEGEVAEDGEAKDRLMANDESFDDFSAIPKVQATFAAFLKNSSGHLRIFRPGIFVVGRGDNSLTSDEDAKLSLCWTSAAIINLVDFCPAKLTLLDLRGYQELNDLVLEYISGATAQNRGQGLVNLEEIFLSKKSFVTHAGFRVLLENLKFLRRIEHPGKMGALFEEGPLRLNFEGTTVRLAHFSQLESISSGGCDEDDHDEWATDILCWTPSSSEVLDGIKAACPHLRTLRLLTRDQELERFAAWRGLEELDVHISDWTGVSTTGLDTLAISLSDTLTKVSLTLLDGYSWTIVDAVGRYCYNLVHFAVEIWTEAVEDAEALDPTAAGERFAALEELNVKCHDHVAYLPQVLLPYFLLASPEYRIIQYIGPLGWLEDKLLVEMMLARADLGRLEMFVLANTQDSLANMRLSLAAVNYLVDACPDLCLVGNLRTWRKIDYYDSESERYYRSESDLGVLKKLATERNWNLELELENLDFYFNNSL